MTTLTPSFLTGFILAGNEDNHKILDGFEIGQYLTKDLS